MEQADLEQLDAVLSAAHRTLGDALVGVYQYGSAVTSGLRRFSDLDVFVVIDRQMGYEESCALLGELMQVSGRRGTRIAGRPVEVTVVRQAVISPWPAEPEREFQYGEWLRDDYDAGFVPERATDHDLAPLIATVLHGSTALFGPRADDVLQPVPRRALLESMRNSVAALLAELVDDTCNVLLTLARIWCTVDTGEIVSKDVAALRVLGALPDDLRGPLEHARQVYLGEADPAFENLSALVTQAAERLAELIRQQPVDQT